jgi:hypothetical protein
LTLASWTPATAFNAFSTRPTHEAQLIPSIGSRTVSGTGEKLSGGESTVITLLEPVH